MHVRSGATLKGSGTIGGAITIEAGATLSPGNSPGLLTINDALTLAGTTLMEIGGQTLGTGYDSIAVSGLLTYGGALNIISHQLLRSRPERQLHALRPGLVAKREPSTRSWWAVWHSSA